MRTNFILLLATPVLICCTKPEKEKVLILKAHLDAFGVESQNFPTIDAVVDFEKDKGFGKRTYYDPQFKPTTYTISKAEIQKLELALNETQLSTLKKKYSAGNISDQPTSTITITTTRGTYTIEDYGEAGEKPLKQLYNTVYKFEY